MCAFLTSRKRPLHRSGMMYSIAAPVGHFGVFMSHPPTLYDLLEVSPHARPSVIRAAYRCLAQSVHPDKHWGDGEASERLSQINGAYAVLSDPQKRRRYDQTLGLQPQFVERRQGDDTPQSNAGAVIQQVHTVRAFAFRPLA